MKLLIKQATILDSSSQFHLQKKDILIENGVFVNIDNEIVEQVDEVIEDKKLYISIGFTDIFSNFNDPGLEQKETLTTGANAAQKGGYTSVFVVPNTKPCIDNKTNVEYIVQQSKNLPVTIYPIAAVTQHTDGKLLTEMIEMFNAGAVAFGDGNHCIQESGVLLKALQYIKLFNGVIVQMPFDASLSANGFVNEGIISTQLGLASIPSIAEEMIVDRDIKLCEHANSTLHLTGISTAKSLALIKAAKAKNIAVTCSVSPYHLLLTDEALSNYDTNAKVNPPLRTNEDVIALQNGILDGTIDAIASHHFPHETDAKQCEFAYAQYGMSTIEHCFNAVASIPNITAENIYTLFAKNIQSIFDLPLQTIAVNQTCNTTIFSLQNEFVVTSQNMISKGKNSAFLNQNLKGKIVATINAQHHYIAK